jgi:hypothetical protein
VKWGLARFLPFEKVPVPILVTEMALVAAEKPACPLFGRAKEPKTMARHGRNDARRMIANLVY